VTACNHCGHQHLDTPWLAVQCQCGHRSCAYAANLAADAWWQCSRCLRSQPVQATAVQS
jgi:hypothetical protein